MRFQRHQSARFTTRRDKRRVFLMVALLGAVIICFQQARDPDNWVWLSRLTESAPQDAAPALDEVDFRVRQTDAARDPGELRVELTEEQRSETDQAATRDEVRVPDDLLKAIEDNRLGALRREQPALDFMLQKTRELSNEQLRLAAERDVAFTVLMLQPEQYRGQLIHLRGQLRRYGPLPQRAGDEGRPPVYEAWLFTHDAGNNPTRVLLAESNDDIPLGDQLSMPVEVTGYFVKRYGYVTQEGEHVAPMLIAKALRLIPAPPLPNPERVSRDLGRFALIFFLATGGVFALIVWRFWASDRRFRQSRLQALADSRLSARHEDLAALQNIETIDPNQMFRDLEQPAAERPPA
jgi:hypothetical protein